MNIEIQTLYIRTFCIFRTLDKRIPDKRVERKKEKRALRYYANIAFHLTLPYQLRKSIISLGTYGHPSSEFVIVSHNAYIFHIIPQRMANNHLTV